jgi:hypothetical protein
MENAKQDYCCPNCQTLLPGESKFCPNCGQKRIHPHDHSVWYLIVESVGDFFHFDSKFFATLRPLLFRPGYLTNEYLSGKRARYFQPFKLFLFISFLYFLISGLMNHKSDSETVVAGVQNKADTNINNTKQGSYQLQLNKAYDKIFALPDDSLRVLVKKYGLSRFVNRSYPQSAWYAKFIIKQVLKNRLQGSETFGENLHKTYPKLIFILIPFFALLLKLLYVRKKIPYFDHLIFSVHFLSCVFILLMLAELSSLVGDWLNLVVYFLLMVYLYFALLRVYHQKKWKTFAKFLLFFFGSFFMLIVFLFIAVSISLLLI